MANTQKKEYRSGTRDWQAGKTWNVDLAFLKDALSDFRCPELAAIEVRINVALNNDVAFGIWDFPRLLPSFQLGDKGDGARFDLDGYSMLLHSIARVGAPGIYWPPQVSSGADPTNFEIIIPLIFESKRMDERSRDARPNVLEFLTENGGKCNLQFAPATVITDVTVLSGSYEVVAHVIEGGAAETGPRMVLKRYNVANREDRYDVGGSLCYALMYAPDDDGTGLESMAGYTEYDSASLDYYDQRFSHLRARWARSGHSGLSMAGLFDPITYPPTTALPIYLPEEGQSTLALPNLDKLHVKLDAAVQTNHTILICAFTDALPVNQARILGVPVSAIGDPKTTAAVQTPKGKKPVSQFPRSLRGRMPIRIAKPKTA